MRMLEIAVIVLVSGILVLSADPVSNRAGGVVGGEQKVVDQPTGAAHLIAELNSVETNFYVNGAPCTNRATAFNRLTNRLTTGTREQRLRSFNLKRQLAEQGVTIRYVDGYYVDATTNAENGHALSKEDKRTLAKLNNVEQTQGNVSKAISGCLVMGGTFMKIRSAKEDLEDEGISFAWDRTNEFYFVASTQAPPAQPKSRWPLERRTSP